ncbi:electron transfer flavoprotein regulatory factor 1 [Dermatophagoides farinae]|nr:electron transfer flavoprotein regulatory factor 1-like [Dermatophagoides farinae]XP_046920288.1 electron transfer flavoprotein regulatory factor 1-like [Dermatophagoides farinae]KAH7638492.1 lyr motif-containing protein [Dermatophagoides farinae]KAH9517751.1 LYR motif-containing protein 5, variant 2 [Dermatophagoides farinae]KAH9517752.1 LYR motif-containing protein 5, variant 3 [Dermatophagoides farinae]
MYPPSISCTLKLTTMVNGGSLGGPNVQRQLRLQVLNLYKTLLYYGRDYPLGYKYFRDRCHKSFVKNRDETDPQQIQKHISRGEFIIKELEALYRLRKYRYLKQRYYPEKLDDDDNDLANKIDPKLILKKFEAKTTTTTTNQQQTSVVMDSMKEEIKQ